MISILFLILITSQVRGQPFNCSDIQLAPNDNHRGFGIYRYFERKDEWSGLQKERILLKRGDIEIEVKISSEMTLEFLNITYTPKERNTICKFSVYRQHIRNHRKIFLNCDVILPPYEDNASTFCKTKDSVKPKDWTRSIGFTNQSFIVKPFVRNSTKVETVLIFDRNQKQKWQRWTGHNDVKWCKEDSSEGCARPQFIREISDYLFNKVDGILDIRISGRTGYIILFTIEGQQKYCFTFDDQTLSKECQSSDQMKTLFDECFPCSQPTNPLIGFLIALAIILLIIEVIYILYNNSVIDIEIIICISDAILRVFESKRSKNLEISV